MCPTTGEDKRSLTSGQASFKGGVRVSIADQIGTVNLLYSHALGVICTCETRDGRHLGDGKESLPSPQLKPDYAYAWNNRGWALENLRRYDEALAAYDKAIQIQPKFQQAIINRSRLQAKWGQ